MKRDVALRHYTKLVPGTENEDAVLFIRVLIECKGDIMRALELSSRWTYTQHMYWLDKSEEYANAINGVKDILVAKAESVMLSRLEAKDSHAAQYVLDRRGAKHGWKQEVKEEASPVTINLSLDRIRKKDIEIVNAEAE